MVRLHRDRLRGHGAVEPAIADSGVESLAGLVPSGEEVLQAHLGLARKEADFLESLDLLVEHRLKKEADFLRDIGGLDQNALDVEGRSEEHTSELQSPC